MRNYVVETLGERSDLLLDRVGHPVRRDEVDVLEFVVVVDAHVPAVGDQVDNRLHPEIISRRGHGQVIEPALLQRVLQHVHQALVVVRVERLHVVVVERYVQHVLVKRPGEVRVNQIPVVHGFTDDPPDELEVGQVRLVDAGVAERLVRAVAGRRQLEQRLVGVEHVPGEEHVPLAGDAAGVDALLAGELNRQPAPQLRRFEVLELHERVGEHLLAVDLRADRAVVRSPHLLALREPFQLAADVRPLVVEIQQARLLQHEAQAAVEQPGLRPDQRVDHRAVLVGKVPHARHPARPVFVRARVRLLLRHRREIRRGTRSRGIRRVSPAGPGRGRRAPRESKRG